MSSIDAINAARVNQGDPLLRWDPFLCKYVELEEGRKCSDS